MQGQLAATLENNLCQKEELKRNSLYIYGYYQTVTHTVLYTNMIQTLTKDSENNNTGLSYSI